MRLQFSAAVLLSLTALASAHFQLQFPEPRGVFVEKQEPTFCGMFSGLYLLCALQTYFTVDGYNTAVDNRTEFPLSGGQISLNSEHPIWTRE